MVTPVYKPTLVAQLVHILVDFRKHANADTGSDIDVRLYVEAADQDWWVSSGDVQFDTITADYCAAASLSIDMTNDDVIEVAQSMCDDIDDQVAEDAAFDDDDDAQQDSGAVSLRDQFPSDCPDRD